MLGPEADCSDIKEPYTGILVTLKQIKTPIVSVDVPSGECSQRLWMWGHRLRNAAWEMSLLAAPTEPWLPLPGRPFPSLEAHVEDKSYATFSSEWSHHTTNTLPAEREHKWRIMTPPNPSLALFLLPVFLFRLGCRRTQTGWDQSGCSNLTYSTEKVRHEFLGEAFLGRTLPAVWHAEKIRA